MDNLTDREKLLRDFKTNFDQPEVKEPFPPGYEGVEAIVNDAQEKLNKLDESIRNPPKDKGPQPGLRPPGSIPNAKSNINEEERKAAIEKQKVEIKEEAWVNIENAAKGGDKDLDKKARDISRERLFPNTYKNLDQKELNNSIPNGRDMEASQDFADAQLKSNHATKEAENASSSLKSDNKEVEEKLSMSTRFLQSLSYPNLVTENHASKEKVAEKELDKETTTISARFDQSFTFRHIDDPQLPGSGSGGEDKDIDRQ